MGEEVQFTDEQWETVARAAETFAAVLAEEQAQLSRVLSSNWAGQCTEGETLFANLQSLLTGESHSFSQQMTAEIDYLRNVATQCRTSKKALNNIDESQREKFPK